DAFGHDAGGPLRDRRDDAGRDQQGCHRPEKFGGRADQGSRERERVGAALDAPAGWVVDRADEHGEQADDASGNDEDERDERRRQRGEQRRLPREGDPAALDRVVKPLLGRLLGLVLVIDVSAHFARSIPYAASSTGAPSSISLRAAMPSTISAMALRALATSRGGAGAPEASSPSTRRRPRDGMEERMALRNSGSVPRS